MRWKPWKCKDCMRPADGQSRPGVLNWIHLKPRFPQKSWFCNMAGSRQEAETTWNKIRCGTLSHCVQRLREKPLVLKSHPQSPHKLSWSQARQKPYIMQVLENTESADMQIRSKRHSVYVCGVCVCGVPTYIIYTPNIIIYMCVSPGCYEWNYIYIHTYSIIQFFW